MKSFYNADTIDDLLNDVLTDLLKLPFSVKASRGTTSEIFGVLLKLNNPLARISRSENRGKALSALGEFLWYLSGKRDLSFIEYYIPKYKENSDDGKIIHGGYGPRLFKMDGRFNQIETIINLLKKNPNTRRAVIQIFDVKDLKKYHKDIPCTCVLQFAIRDKKLHMYTTMRSNDAYWGLPHDIFCFTMLQEVIARSVGVELGTYNHAVASLHLYRKHKEEALQYLSEGYQSTKFSMPPMPHGDPWPSIKYLRTIEKKIRCQTQFNFVNDKIDPYWRDLIILLSFHSVFKNKAGNKNKINKINALQTGISNDIYKSYIATRLNKLKVT